MIRASLPRQSVALLFAALLIFCASGLAQAEVVQRDRVRVAFSGTLTPSTLPRSRPVPVEVTMGGKIMSTGKQKPPQLRRISIAVNRSGRLSGAGLPVCRIWSASSAARVTDAPVLAARRAMSATSQDRSRSL